MTEHLDDAWLVERSRLGCIAWVASEVERRGLRQREDVPGNSEVSRSTERLTEHAG